MARGIDPTSDRPVFRQIADQLRDAIRQGRYSPGDALPSETDLANTYDVTRMTARQAVEVLKAEGIVRSQHGKGTFVIEKPPLRRLARNRQARAFRETGRGAFDAEIRALGMTPRVDLVKVGPVTPPPDIADALTLDEGEQALIRQRRMYADDAPETLATSYVPWSLAEGTQMTEEDTGPGGIYSRLADIGHEPVSFIEEVTTDVPTDEQRAFFQSPKPIFRVFRTALDASGRAVEVNEIIIPNRWSLVYGWREDDSAR